MIGSTSNSKAGFRKAYMHTFFYSNVRYIIDTCAQMCFAEVLRRFPTQIFEPASLTNSTAGFSLREYPTSAEIGLLNNNMPVKA